MRIRWSLVLCLAVLVSACGEQEGPGASPVTAESQQEGPVGASPVTAESQWLNPDGNLVVVEEVCKTSEDDPHIVAGAVLCGKEGAIVIDEQHCGWQGTMFLSTRGRVYVRDEQRVPSDAVNTSFASDVDVPDTVHDTGLHTDQVWLWVSSVDGQEAAYLVGGDGKAERWPEVVAGCTP